MQNHFETHKIASSLIKLYYSLNKISSKVIKILNKKFSFKNTSLSAASNCALETVLFLSLIIKDNNYLFCATLMRIMTDD